MRMNGSVVGIGELLWDIFPGGKTPGGATSNFTYYVAQFGLDARLVSAVGSDPAGDELERALHERGVPTLIQRNSFPTGTVTVELDGAGVPAYTIHEHTAWDRIAYTDAVADLAARCSAVCFGTLGQRSPVSRETILRFLRETPAEALRIFDVNFRQHFYSEEVLTASLELSDVVKLNEDEAAVVSRLYGYPSGDLLAVCHRLRADFALRLLILTRGAQDSYVFSADGISHLDTPRVAVVDTVGAGDAFTGSFCAALLRGGSLRDAHRLAVDVSAWVCTQAGGMPPLSAELRGRLK